MTRRPLWTPEEAAAEAESDDQRRRRKRRERRLDAADAGESGAEAFLEGCGCELPLITLTIMAGASILLIGR